MDTYCASEPQDEPATFLATPGFTYVSAIIDKAGTIAIGRVKGTFDKENPYRSLQIYIPELAKSVECTTIFVNALTQREINAHFLTQFYRLAGIRLGLQREMGKEFSEFQQIFVPRPKTIRIFQCKCEKATPSDIVLKCSDCSQIICWKCGACRCCKKPVDD